MDKNICTMCKGSGVSTNYSKLVDPPVQQYGTILGDAPQQGDNRRRVNKNCPDTCLPLIQNPNPNSPQASTVVQVPNDPIKPCPNYICEPCPPPPPTKIWLIKSSPVPQKVGLNKFLMFLLSFCLPIGKCNLQQPGGCKPIMVCLPCQPSMDKTKKNEEEDTGPIGLITRNQDADFVGGKFIGGCTCGRRNGLGGTDCPRISCQNNPGCTMNPPRCWPQYNRHKTNRPKTPPPDQKLICLPVEVVYFDSDKPTC